MNILVLDDDQYFLDRMKTLLELENHSTAVTTSCTEALQKSHQVKFDLILTDLKMPEFSGIEFLKKVKKIQEDSPIIVITGYGTVESAVEAIKTGAHDYLLKPFDFSILKEKIRDIEKDKIFKERFKIPIKLEEFSNQLLQDQNLGDNHEEPFLLISDEDPQAFVDKYNLSNATLVWLDSNKGNGEPFQSLMEELKNKVDSFVNDNQKGTIIFKGIENLSRTHHREKIQNFLVYIQTKVIPHNIQFLILVERERMSFGAPQIQKMLSTLINPAFEKIIEIISHTLRRRTILLLNSCHGLSFNEIINELEIESSPVFAFHLRKLVNEEILIKEKVAYTTGHKYCLSFKGIYLAEIIQILEQIGEEGPFSSTKILEIQKAAP